ncbi:DUF5343 domain-containing protein [Phenylobacterium sp.]|uniref:DUF5343 domain-containing protein n=1 Tax=Phenylobacterium sp. TaxID=1871053 RepID=UPI0035B320A0
MAKDNAAAAAAPGEPEAASAAKRKIPGNLPYLTSHGTMKTVLERIVDPQIPPKFNSDFLENVLGLKGGSARATIPIMKKMGFVTSDGVPTELYGKFRTTGGRGAAALLGLQTAFAEIFRRSTYAHTVPDAKLKDLVVEVTGLSASDPVATAIRGTFNAIKSFVPADVSLEPAKGDVRPAEESEVRERNGFGNGSGDEDAKGIRLAYNINIVLPETSDLTVLNAIFKSIKENLMR